MFYHSKLCCDSYNYMANFNVKRMLQNNNTDSKPMAYAIVYVFKMNNKNKINFMYTSLL